MPKRGSRLWFLEGKELGAGFDHRHLGAETREGLPELDANGASPEDRQRSRQLPWNRRLAVGPVFDAVEARDRRNRRRAAVRDHDGAPRDELLAPHCDRTRIGEFPFASKELGTSTLYRGRRSTVVEVTGHPQHASGYFAEIDGPFHARGCEPT